MINFNLMILSSKTNQYYFHIPSFNEGIEQREMRWLQTLFRLTYLDQFGKDAADSPDVDLGTVLSVAH